MDESASQNHLLGSSSLGREHRKIVFADVCVLGGFFPVCFSLPQPVGEPAPGALTTLRAWAEVPWGVLPGTMCDGPECQSRLQLSNPRLRGTREITFLEPALSYLSLFHSRQLETLPQLSYISAWEL